MAKTREDEGKTAKIVQEYASRIDTNVDYELKDLKKIMTTVYKEITTHKTPPAKPAKPAKVAKPAKTAQVVKTVKVAQVTKDVITIDPGLVPEPVSKTAPETASMPASEPASKPASMLASEPASKQAPEEESSEDEDAPKKRGRPKKEPKLDKNGVLKPKRKPSSYNNFVKERIEALKKEQNGTVIARILMVIAAGEWKNMTQDEKDAYKK